jgi:hypothetical protein
MLDYSTSNVLNLISRNQLACLQRDTFQVFPPQSKSADICNVSNILTVGSEPVISFFKRGKFISLGLPFCFFMNFTVYVIGVD